MQLLCDLCPTSKQSKKSCGLVPPGPSMEICVTTRFVVNVTPCESASHCWKKNTFSPNVFSTRLPHGEKPHDMAAAVQRVTGEKKQSA